MNKRPPSVCVAFPCQDLLKEFAPQKDLLGLIQLDVKQLVQIYLRNWASLESDKRFLMMEGNVSCSFGMQELLIYDMIYDERGNPLFNVSTSDLEHLRATLSAIWQQMVAEFISLIEEMDLTDDQLSGLEPYRWIGPTLILSIPLSRRA